jgi:soluble lytic murein transglycosylase
MGQWNMLTKIIKFFFVFVLFHNSFASKFDQFYLPYFKQYQQYYTNTPVNPDIKFLTIINSKTHLADKLREKWLYTLAQHKEWQSFINHYKTTNDINLQCLYQRARYEIGQQDSAMHDTIKLWLSPDSSPLGCSKLFELFEHSKYLTNELVKKRIVLALHAEHASLARYLMLKYKPQALSTNKLLASIQQNPLNIKKLSDGFLHDELFLYGLRQLIDTKRDIAQNIWKQKNTQKRLTTEQNQFFLVDLTIHKARRQDNDTPEWFWRIYPKYYTPRLLEWQTRFYIGKQKWQRVIKLIEMQENKNDAIWQYWLARSYEKTGQNDKARKIYQKLHHERGYYGFLSSYKLNLSPEFNEQTMYDKNTIKIYDSILHEIKQKYQTHKYQEASQEINDFTSMLPVLEKASVITWIINNLNWYSKAIFLSQDDSMYHYLNLRFPIAYQDIISPLATRYNVNKSLIYSIIRQESSFNSDARSGVGALGLMQLMPGIANSLAKQEHIKLANPKKDLFNIKTNIHLGIAMLKNLKKSFNDQPLLMAAAYNGGPTAVRRWLNIYPSKETDIWIEILPWHETREYMKNIMAFHIVYDYLTKQPLNICKIINF